MKAKFKVKDEFRLKKDMNFTRSFPPTGLEPGQLSHNLKDKANKRAGSVATVCEIYDVPATSRAKVTYSLDFGNFRLSLKEQELLELFEPVTRA